MVASEPASGASNSVSWAIIETVAEAEGVDPIELEPPLYEKIDPDALNQLLQPTTARKSTSVDCLTFTYSGYEVTVYSDNRVTIQKL